MRFASTSRAGVPCGRPRPPRAVTRVLLYCFSGPATDLIERDDLVRAVFLGSGA